MKWLRAATLNKYKVGGGSRDNPLRTFFSTLFLFIFVLFAFRNAAFYDIFEKRFKFFLQKIYARMSTLSDGEDENI